ncbi:hypothetical protein JQ582_30305 [Bradyrhizobium japonicum]|uniref:hypothetical protein n=1 Tax=Bradyrhizobium japonicum TaxID=375 RepID=UPI001BA503F2|nr:hypothetical protein [Bradyrhizobium japonicum]MBR0748233.1 hypothetical protein [Bradyrhizobium japonicum]
MDDNKLQKMMSSKGMDYINRAHYRSFSRDIFRGNTNQLLNLLASLTDPLEYSALLAAKDLEKSHEVMREVSRLFHNFLAAAMTLVDHTRVFVDEYYLGTQVKREFSDRVNRTFANNPLTRFVQDLRNYMVHRGLPPVQRHLTVQPVEGGKLGETTAETGFQLSTADLLEWTGWKSDAKKYLAEAGMSIELLPLISRYRILIETFHNEFDDLLREHHKADLEFLAAMEGERIASHN